LTIEKKANALQDAFGDVQVDSGKSVLALLSAGKALADIVVGFKEKF
jgi:hypothetical protein